MFILLRKMSSNSVKANRIAVNFLWKQNIRIPKEISSRTGIPLRTCQRYVALLKKKMEKFLKFAGQVTHENYY